jgi:hypothetical protein
VPYRDYPLTALFAAILQSSRTTYAMMLACVASGEPFAVETRTTLEYAARGSTLDRSEREAYRRSLTGTDRATDAAADAAAGSDDGTADESAAAPAGEPSSSGAAQSGAAPSAAASTGAGEEQLKPWAMRMIEMVDNAPAAESEVSKAMENDQLDPDRELNRRTELVEMRNGHVFCRSCGDAGMPLVLYLHAPTKGAGSASWNGCVTAVAAAKRESTRQLLARASTMRDEDGGLATPAPLASAASRPSSRASSRLSSRRTSRSPLRGERQGPAGLLTSSSLQEEEAEDDGEYDDTFAKCRAKLSSVLLRRQRELAQTTCSLCSALLLQPRRMMRCRHVLCALCVERSIVHHSECPVCAAPSGDPPVDVEHDELIRMRLSLVVPLPKMITQWQTRLAEAEQDRRQSQRVLLEFGSHVAEAGASSKVTVFLGLIQHVLAPGVFCAVHRGSECMANAPHNLVIDRVTFDCTPDDKSEDKLLDVFHSPNRFKGERLGYVIAKRLPRGRTVVITVHWAAEVGIAPLEVRHKIGRVAVGRFERRIVVQLPSETPVLPEGTRVRERVAWPRQPPTCCLVACPHPRMCTRCLMSSVRRLWPLCRRRPSCTESGATRRSAAGCSMAHESRSRQLAAPHA